jgi:hypothetical protein
MAGKTKTTADGQEKQSKFPSEMIDLPSEGKCYPEGHALASGKIEIKYMTAREEDILTSQNLIKKGVVLDKLLESLILTPGVQVNDLVLGDKNAVMIASRILAYGPEYTCEVTHPTTGVSSKHTFNLADCPFKKLPDGLDYTGNKFEVDLPISKTKVAFKVLNGHDEADVQKALKGYKKVSAQVAPELTMRLKKTIVEANGETSDGYISQFVDNMLARDSLYLREQIKLLTPDIDLEQDIDLGGDDVTVTIPMTVTFLWPNAAG